MSDVSWWSERIHPDDMEGIKTGVRLALDKGEQVWSGEYRFRRRNGEYAPVIDRGYIVRDGVGKPMRMIGSMADLTSRKQSEEIIREQAALLAIAHDAILVRDLEDRICFWNQGAQRLYGWTAEEALGRKISEFLYRSIPEVLEKAREELIQNGEWRGELPQITKDGKEIAVDSHWTLVRDEKGNPKSVLKVNSDITDKKRMEKQFLQAQRLENLGTLAGGIAHDLNNVLAPILMAVQLLKMKPLDDQQRQWCDAIEVSAKRGGRMVNQVLSFSRGTGGERVPLHIKHVISELEKITHETFPRSIQFRTSLPETLWTVVADFTQLYQVMLNLCVNARDAMPNGGIIHIEAENVEIDRYYAGLHVDVKPGRYLILTVSDTGEGIPPGVLDKIFDPFFTTKEVGKGTGLGLSTVLGIIKSHGGFVRVYSEVGKGTVFKLYLPAEAGSVAESKESLDLEPYRGHGELVLVVDDEKDILEMTRMTLEAHGYRACLANDGTEAVALYVQRMDEIAVVITDIMMPYLDGVATIRALQKLRPTVKIVAVSGLEMNENAAEANAVRPVAFIRKPYTAEKFLMTLHGVLHQQAPHKV